ncbi:DUF397 domain-containing protein [Streptomyces sp. NPDC051561]|uniref:DUF397 domain-containing protein n=1 Tax=Streptomyces sp. NPDC051561 TaxID=3365658 RepID=UPI0037B85DC5
MIPNPPPQQRAAAGQYSSAVWRVSSHSSGGTNCVEVATLGSTTIGVQDSKNRHLPPLLIPNAAFTRFIGFLSLPQPEERGPHRA